jgi:hypothetical protein
MRPLHRTLFLAAALAIAASPSMAQQSTEIYIPIGRSPGLSGKHTLLGKIESIDASDRSMNVVGTGRSAVTVRPGPQTKVWLDYSELKQRNREGGYTDYRKDQKVEIKYRNNDRQSGVVEWVKVQMSP